MKKNCFLCFALTLTVLLLTAGTSCVMADNGGKGGDLIAFYDFDGNINNLTDYAVGTGERKNASTEFLTDSKSTDTTYMHWYGGTAPGYQLQVTVPKNVSKEYSIAMRFSYSKVTGWNKIIDYRNNGVDIGFYIRNNLLEFYNYGYTGKTHFAANSIIDLIVTRSAKDNKFSVYSNVDGTFKEEFSFIDTDNFSVGYLTSDGKTIFNFLGDEPKTNTEYAPEGRVYSIKIWDYALTMEEAKTAADPISIQFTYPDGEIVEGAPTSTNDAGYCTVPDLPDGYEFWLSTNGETYEPGNEIKISVATTLVASKTVSVRFKCDGFEFEPVERILGGKYSTLPMPSEKTGFLGWFLSTDGTGQVTENTVVTKGNTHTLYGLWENAPAPEEEPEPTPEPTPTPGPESDKERFETDSEINYHDGYIHYNSPECAHVIIYARKADEDYKPTGAECSDVYLDLTTETITSNFEYDCYSINGGSKWSACSYPLTAEHIGKWFSTKRKILIANNFDTITKKPGEGATIYYIGETQKRASIGSVKINYYIYRDDYGIGRGQWGLVTGSGKPVDYSNYEFLITDSYGLTIARDYLTDNENGTEIAGIDDVKEYGRWPQLGGVWVPEMNENGTPAKAKIICRCAARYDSVKGYIPASKTKKLTVASSIKAPKLKVSYRDEILKLKKGTFIYFGNHIELDSDHKPIAFSYNPDAEINSYEDLAGVIRLVSTSGEAKKGIDLSKYINETRNSVMLWQRATEKKPASAVQTIQLAARKSITEERTLTVKNGKVTLPSEYEVYRAELKSKWTRKINLTMKDTVVLPIRLKVTAKGGAESDDKYATGIPGTLVMYYGAIDGNGKMGCVEAVVYPSNYDTDTIDAKITEWYAAHTTDEPEEPEPAPEA